MIQREAYLKQVQGQKEIVMHYIKDHKIVFSEISERVTEDTRKVFLQWIAQANMNSQKRQNRIRTGIPVNAGKRNLCSEV